ncbi:MAG: hypothetical protein AAFY41_10350 [Bacteroidota bacterium]
MQLRRINNMSSSKSQSIATDTAANKSLPSNEKEKRQNEVAATAAGAGSGTLVALIANNLSDSNWIKTWLVLIAPSLSIVSGAIWVWLQTKFIDSVKEFEFRLFIVRSINTIDEALQDPNLSEERLLELQKMRNELTQAKIERIMKKFKSIKITDK